MVINLISYERKNALQINKGPSGKAKWLTKIFLNKKIDLQRNCFFTQLWLDKYDHDYTTRKS